MTIPFVGKILVSELLLLVIIVHAAIALASARTLPSPLPSPRILALVLIAQLVAFASYIVSDLSRQSVPVDMLRGWLRMMFLLLDTVALALLFGAGTRTFVLFLIGIVFSSLFTFLDGPLYGDYWKFCLAYPFTVVVLLATPRLIGSWATAAAALVLGLLHLRLGYRSLGWECLLLAGLLTGSITLPRLWRKYLFIACTAVLLTASPSIVGNFFSGPSEPSRSDVERSSMMQAAWEGFLASPIIGNGSWFSRSNVWDNFLLIRSQRERESGRGLGFDSTNFEGRAIHSQILTALAEGGFLGASFFLLYTALLVLGLWFLLTDARWHWLMPMRLSILISSLYGLFMSPFAGTARLDISVGVVLSLVLLAERRAYISRWLREPLDVWSRYGLPGDAPPRSS